MHGKYTFQKLCVFALILGLTVPLRAEMKSQYNSQGNNVGIAFSVGAAPGSPMGHEYNNSGGYHQFPRGSGNIYNLGRISYNINAIVDYDGDGVAGDTVFTKTRGHDTYNMRQSLEFYDQIMDMVAAGEDMQDATARITSNRIWTSLDADDLADWPAEFREGRSPGGEPVVHGAETVVSFRGNAFNTGANQRLGISAEYSYYFLNYGESNNMVYSHCFIRNMSEYCQYNEDPDFLEKIAGTATTGQTWQGMMLTHTMSYWFTGSAWSQLWAHRYFPKKIFAVVDDDGTNGSYTGYPHIMASHILRLPEFKGQQMEMLNSNCTYWSTELGFTSQDPLIDSVKDGSSYCFALGRFYEGYPDPNYAGYANNENPWFGGPCYGWPGVPLESDPRSDQWIWGATNAGFSEFWYGLFDDVAPRDSFSVDDVFMFVPAVSDPFDPPPLEFDNIDDQSVQDQLANVDAYADVANVVFEGGFVLPETPVPPPLTIVPGDKEVTITWSDVNVNTADAYYYFLQDHPELDPDGVYREYDFEGYRFYRSFVGPNDSHSELLMDCNLTDDNVQFYYIDKQTDDRTYSRMNNGMKVWYALVPYDKNYDTSTGEAFSLPSMDSGKQWNRPGNNLYTVEPRSDATNFRNASLDQTIAYTPADGITPDSDKPIELAGQGGDVFSLVDNPKILTPLTIGELQITPVLDECITEEKNLTLVCTDRTVVDGGCTGMRMNVQVALTLFEGSLEAGKMTVTGGVAETVDMDVSGPVHDYGIEYTVSGQLINTRWAGTPGPASWEDHGSGFFAQMENANTSDYTAHLTTGRWCGDGDRPGSSPSNLLTTRSGTYQITWQSSGDDLTVEVQDVVRGITLPHVDYPDEFGWGFQTKPDFGETIGGAENAGQYYAEAFIDKLPKSDRTVQMPSTIAAENTQEFGLFVNGTFWEIAKDGEDGITMPAAGTVWTMKCAYGIWSPDGVTFTQVPDLPFVGDKWTIKILPSSLDPEDADLSKIRVVPNPYLASSFLDLSPDSRRVDFVNLPDRCTIRIYSLGGHLVNVLNHIGANRHGWGDYTDYDRLNTQGEPAVFTGYDNHGGSEPWNLRNRFGQTVASGLYFYHVTDPRGETFTGRFYIVN